MPTHALVVGGGPTGLAAACTFAGHGARTTLVEVLPSVGGSVFTQREGGFVLDAGPWHADGAAAIVGARLAAFSAQGGRLIVQMAVTGVAQGPGGAVQACLENGLAFDADVLVLALPAPRAAQALRACAPGAAAQLGAVLMTRWASAGLGWHTRPTFDRAALPPGWLAWHTDGPPRAPQGGCTATVMLPLAADDAVPTAAEVTMRLGLPVPDAAVVRVWHHPHGAAPQTDDDAMTPLALPGLPARVVVAATVQHHTADLARRLRAGEAAAHAALG